MRPTPLSRPASRPTLAVSFAALVVASAPFSGFPQEPPAAPAGDAANTNAQLAAEFVADEAVRYEIRRRSSPEEAGPDGDEPGAALELVSEPVLRWSNPTGGEVYGAVVLWTRDGRPEAAASIYRFFNRNYLNVELVSLSEEPLVAERNGRVRWTPAAGIEFKPVPGAPAPTDTVAGRRLQARTVAREFSAELAGRNAGDEFSPLRLLSRPLHHYEAADGSGRDGAVFSMSTTNDPGLLLLLESRPTADGPKWFWAAARMDFVRLRLSHAGRTVWEAPQVAPPWGPVRGPEGTYVILEWRSPEAAAKD